MIELIQLEKISDWLALSVRLQEQQQNEEGQMQITHLLLQVQICIFMVSL